MIEAKNKVWIKVRKEFALNTPIDTVIQLTNEFVQGILDSLDWKGAINIEIDEVTGSIYSSVEVQLSPKTKSAQIRVSEF